jgi:hypothetical protein
MTDNNAMVAFSAEANDPDIPDHTFTEKSITLIYVAVICAMPLTLTTTK